MALTQGHVIFTVGPRLLHKMALVSRDSLIGRSYSAIGDATETFIQQRGFKNVP